MSETSFKVPQIKMSKASFELLSTEQTTSFDTKMDVVSKIFKNSPTVKVFIEIAILGKSDKGVDVFKMSAVFIGDFTYDGAPKVDQTIENFAKGNAPAILYPFTRASMANLCLAANLPVITLPIINFFKFPVKIEIEE